MTRVAGRGRPPPSPGRRRPGAPRPRPRHGWPSPGWCGGSRRRWRCLDAIPGADLVVHHFVNDLGWIVGVFIAGSQGVAEIVGAVQVDCVDAEQPAGASSAACSCHGATWAQQARTTSPARRPARLSAPPVVGCRRRAGRVTPACPTGYRRPAGSHASTIPEPGCSGGAALPVRLATMCPTARR